MSNDILSEVNRKLDVIIRILAYQVVAKMTLSEGAPLLKRIGLNASEIAAVYDSSPKSISVRISEARRREKGKP
jgi:hypothetical protein